MNTLPPEILIKIFNELKEIKKLIAISKVCKYFKDIILSHTRQISIELGSSESREQIEDISKIFGNFSGLRAAKLEISYDANLTEKADFCKKHSTNITHLVLSEITFLNPILDHQTFDNLITVQIQKCDLVSCSQTFADFILSCRSLKHLTISYCDGLDIDALNSIGRQLHTTQIENFELFPTYSYYDVSSQHDNDDSEFWRIDKLKNFSVRSSTKEIVVMKKNFVRKMLGRMVCNNLTKLELNAELNYGDDNFVLYLINHFPSLDTLLLGRGVSSMKNQDFVNICNGFKNLQSLEFHFVQADSALEIRSLQSNSTINNLTLGITKEVKIEDLKFIASRFKNLEKVSIIFYNIQRPSQEYLKEITKIFPRVQCQKTGQKNSLQSNFCVT